MDGIFHQWERQRDRLLLWLPVLFGTGIGIYFSLTFEPSLWLAMLAPLLAALAFWMRRNANHRSAAWVFAATVIAGGFMAAQWRTQDVATPMLQKRTGPTTLTGQAMAVETFADGWRVTLADPHVNGLQRHLTPKRVRLRLRGAQPRILPGDWIQARAILSPPSPPAMPGAFDFQRHAYFQSIGGVGFALGAVHITAKAETGSTRSPANALARLRGHITERILKALPEGTGAVAAALITGARHAIPEADLQAMRDSGLAHLLSISGLHIGLVASLLFAAVRTATALVPALVLNHPTKKWARPGSARRRLRLRPDRRRDAADAARFPDACGGAHWRVAGPARLVAALCRLGGVGSAGAATGKPDECLVPDVVRRRHHADRRL